MRIHSRKIAAAVLVSSAALLAACVPGGGGGGGGGGPVTTTSSATYSCSGIGLAFGTVIPNQTVNIALTRPATVTAGSNYTVSVDLTVDLSRPTFIDFNALGVPGDLNLTSSPGGSVQGTNSNVWTISGTPVATAVPGAVGTPTHWTDVGPPSGLNQPALVNFPPNSLTGSQTTATITAPPSAGTQTLTGGDLNVVFVGTGANGYACKVVGTPPSWSIPIS
jgi:hypothetical protein